MTVDEWRSAAAAFQQYPQIGRAVDQLGVTVDPAAHLATRIDMDGLLDMFARTPFLGKLRFFWPVSGGSPHPELYAAAGLASLTVLELHIESWRAFSISTLFAMFLHMPKLDGLHLSDFSSETDSVTLEDLPDPPFLLSAIDCCGTVPQAATVKLITCSHKTLRDVALFLPGEKQYVQPILAAAGGIADLRALKLVFYNEFPDIHACLRPLLAGSRHLRSLTLAVARTTTTPSFLRKTLSSLESRGPLSSLTVLCVSYNEFCELVDIVRRARACRGLRKLVFDLENCGRAIAALEPVPSNYAMERRVDAMIEA